MYSGALILFYESPHTLSVSLYHTRLSREIVRPSGLRLLVLSMCGLLAVIDWVEGCIEEGHGYWRLEALSVER